MPEKFLFFLMERKKDQLLLGVTVLFPSCVFSDIRYRIQWSFTSSPNVSIASFYYRAFSPALTLQDQFYTALGLRKALALMHAPSEPSSTIAPRYRTSTRGTGPAPELLTSHRQLSGEAGHCCWILSPLALNSHHSYGVRAGHALV